MSQLGKRFPAEIHRGKDENIMQLKKLFLYNKKIDALLYAFLQQKSVPVQLDDGTYETRVYKEQIPTQDDLCRIIRVGSRVTLRNRMSLLKENGFLEEYKEYYVLKNPEKAFLHIPIDTLKFLIDACSSETIKTYIYLVQSFKYAETERRKYLFTKEQIMRVVGISVSKVGYEKINNILDCLINNQLVVLQDAYFGKSPRIKISSVNLYHKKN